MEETLDPYSTAEVYYGRGALTENSSSKSSSNISRVKTASALASYNTFISSPLSKGSLKRRGSQDLLSAENNRKFIIPDVDATLQRLLEVEDTDHNNQITIEDSGPKVLTLGTVNSNGYNKAEIRGTYMLYNLLQELTLAQRFGRKAVVLDESRLNENPVKRLNRLITHTFWKSLTRTMEAENIHIFAADSKARYGENHPRIYVPYNEPDQFKYFSDAAAAHPEHQLEVIYLPKDITPEWVKSVNEKPGLLALAMDKVEDPETGEVTMKPIPYVVPGGRFNELYGWDSYMIALGLLVDDQVDLAKGMVEHFIFQINHYGKILNANRSYYLTRSQPPFLTDMTLRVYEKIKFDRKPALEFMKRAFRAAIKEYESVWCAEPRLDPKSGLSRYRPDTLGIPPETEPSHFTLVLTPYAEKHNLPLEEFQKKYNDGTIKEPELDEYFLHDIAIRESGHDTTYRFEKKCARLATVDLNSLLFKYEVDIAHTIRTYFNDALEMEDGTVQKSAIWVRKAKLRRDRMNKYMWNERKGMFFDYDTERCEQCTYESVTTFWTMWAGLASPRQGVKLVEVALPKFEMFGGLVSGTKESRGEIGMHRPNRQWDFPYGWAPHQILAWNGLIKYGYGDDAERLCYRWLYLITKAFVDYNGIVVEKYDVTRTVDPHKVDAEYGNQGADFKGVATEGFGWVNASFVLGLTLLNSHAKRALGTCTPPDLFFSSADTFFDFL